MISDGTRRRQYYGVKHVAHRNQFSPNALRHAFYTRIIFDMSTPWSYRFYLKPHYLINRVI